MKENNKMLLDVNEKPPILKWILLSLQHVFAMFGATILVPILVNTAVGASDNPIIIIIGPTTIGGNSLLIHFLPISLIINTTNTYTSPTAIIAVNTLDFPLFANPTIIGEINANELPKYTGLFPLVQMI